MKAFPASAQFCFPWRPYQARVLAELSEHLDDDRLNVIAPPGSGKTVLGLEVVRRLNRPTLILSPTITIRDQWVDRFVQLFLPAPHVKPDWISFDLNRPAFLTVSTYQALHALHTGGPVYSEREEEPEEGSVEADEIDDEDDSPPVRRAPSKKKGRSPFAPLNRAGIRTIVVDEAHHLKNAWWRSLTALRAALRKPVVVSLTATPPYDVSHAEWSRYKTLCGPVDSQIGVPELLLEKNLCPHQDYLYFSLPAPGEAGPIGGFRDAVRAFREEILLDFDFIDAVEGHPWMVSPEAHFEAIFERTETFSAMLIFLNAVDRWIAREALDALGVRREEMPPLDLAWLEILLTHLLFRDQETVEAMPERVSARLNTIRRRLGRMGAVARRKVTLRSTGKIRKQLTASAGKLESIVEIVRREADSLKDAIRLVVLADYIHAGDMPSAAGELKPLNRIGVVPVFERLRREHLWEIRPGILSGSLVVVPESAVTDLEIIAIEAGIDHQQLSFEPLAHDPGYCIVKGSGAADAKMVRMITELFRLGRVNALVGTKSLLGEGWDAPWINSLILATWVGSWVLSNQMRGRAIRVESGNPEKTANIWHLVCEEPGVREKGDDMAALDRRMKAFVGVSASGDRIESGIDRLELPRPPRDAESLAALNRRSVQDAADREGLRRKWASALKGGRVKGTMKPALRTPRRATASVRPLVVRKIRGLLLQRTLLALLAWIILFGFALALADSLLFWVPVAAAVLVFFAWLPRTFRILWRWVRHGSEGESLRRIGEAVVGGLIYTGAVRPSKPRISLRVRREKDGDLRIHPEGGTTFERSLFLDSLEEILEPVENPRYLIREKSGRKEKNERVAYYAVPAAIGRKKDFADRFLSCWRTAIGPAELIYTRTPAGRKELVKARLQSLSAGDALKAQRLEIWR